MEEDTIVVLAILAFLTVFVVVMMWPAIVHAKVDVDTSALPTFVDSKGVIHIRGWVKNITNNETDTDVSVEMKFNNGHFLVFYLGQVSNPAKTILAPGQVFYWDYSTTNKLYAGPYHDLRVRYNEIPYTQLINLGK